MERCCFGCGFGAIFGQLVWGFRVVSYPKPIDINGFNHLARRVAEVSRFKDFKDCDVIGSKDKVCL